MAENLIPKRLGIARATALDAAAIVRGIEDLQARAALLAQTGGNFSDGDPNANPVVPSDFEGQSDLAYAVAYNFNLALQTGASRLAGVLNEGINPDGSGPKIGDILRLVMGA